MLKPHGFLRTTRSPCVRKTVFRVDNVEWGARQLIRFWRATEIRNTRLTEESKW